MITPSAHRVPAARPLCVWHTVFVTKSCLALAVLVFSFWRQSAADDLPRACFPTPPYSPEKRLITKNPAPIPYSYPKNEVLSIDPVKLGACVLSVVREFPEAAFRRDKMNQPFDFFSFMLYLEAGNRDGDFETGKERGLRSWVLAQKDNSIDPVSLFRQAMRLGEGNLWNALLMIHQLLRNEARWWEPNRYCYESDSGKEHSFFNKFIDIRGDLVERGGAYEGDHEGSWYRLWGTWLGRLAVFSSGLESRLRSKSPPEGLGMCPLRLDVAPSGLMDSFLAWVAENHVTDMEMHKGEIEPSAAYDTVGKTWVNLAGVRSLSAFLELLKQDYPLASSQACASPSYYLVKGTWPLPLPPKTAF